MAADRQKMIDVLKLLVVPSLRDRGFKGSFPHFRRIEQNKTDVLTFQFDKWGGGFIIEIGSGTPEGTILPWGEVVPATKLTAHDLYGSDRARLSSGPKTKTGKWFRYDDNTQESFEAAADEVLNLLPQADLWWEGKKNQLNLE